MTALMLMLIFAGFLIGWIVWYHIGYHWGFEAGREHELDKVTQRHIRMSRFRVGLK
jgi:membrane protein DedA with SNARE-associated domain